MTFFIFRFCCTSTHQDEFFLILSKFHIFSRSENSWGNKQNVNFRLKMTPQAKKMTFFQNFLAHLPIKTKLFCFYQTFISSAVQRNHGGTRKRVTSTTTTTTTTNYMDDHNTPSGFFQNPRANNNSKHHGRS